MLQHWYLNILQAFFVKYITYAWTYLDDGVVSKVSETSNYHGCILETVIACLCYFTFKIIT